MKKTILSICSAIALTSGVCAQPYKPFVRWWWNGDRVEEKEIIRELNLLNDAGIGGVEINPIELPYGADDLGIPALDWLSDGWIDMLKTTFDEAKKLGMTCDLLIGSGWPFGSEALSKEDRASVMLTYAEKVEGPCTFERSKYSLMTLVDPGVTVTNPRRTAEIFSVGICPDPISDISQYREENFENEDVIRIEVPAGPHCIYVMVRFDSFASVINGAPGAMGSILNHLDAGAVRRYLDRMADAIEEKTGPLSEHLRSFFVDSMELEGCNWCNDFPEEFKRRRGYDLMPWLPLTMFKVGRLGEAIDYNYGASKTKEFQDRVNRARYDFELTKAELLHERYTLTFLEWCREKGVKSRAQTYGRGFFPLETALGYDIPEGESWTTNWLRHKLGEEMGDQDYRRGRGYTMINKYVSSAANLTGKRIVSSEEMTNTYKVFYTSLEFLKIGSDMGVFSGTTHSVWSGYNYSPPQAEFPGWVQYGSFSNERNPWWPYFKYLNAYRERISTLVQNADMCTDIALLPANDDLWTTLGVQTDPFPWYLNVPYTSLIWEAIHKTGGGADYVSGRIIEDAVVKGGKLCYGPKKYSCIFLIEVNSISQGAIDRLLEFARAGGRVFCIGCSPDKSLGLNNFASRDERIKETLEQLSTLKDNFIILDKPDDGRYLEWYADLMREYGLPYDLAISNPDRFLLHNHYRDDAGRDLFFLANVNLSEARETGLLFPDKMRKGRKCYLMDPDNGQIWNLPLKNGRTHLRLGPATAYILILDRGGMLPEWKALPVSGRDVREVKDWTICLHHSQKEWTKTEEMNGLKDLQIIPEYSDFMGDVVYKATVSLNGRMPEYINLGKVCETCELKINGCDCGVKWFGEKVYDIRGLLHEGENEIEVKVTTLTGNYVRTLEDNKVAQRFILKRNQPFAPMGILGPVHLYRE